MKTLKPILIVVLILAGLSVSTAAGQGSKSGNPISPRGVVVNLYKQHKQRSPFFQTKSRALLDKYFARELADLLWEDAHTSSDEVGALDGDPLFNAQDMEIKKFVVEPGTLDAQAAEVPVSFENFGDKHRILFRLIMERGGWRVADIGYDEGMSLLQLLKSDSESAKRRQEIRVYLVALGDDGKTGKKIGCNDSLVSVAHTIKKTAAPLTAALRELLSTPQHSDGTPSLENFWKGRNLKVSSVTIRNRTATIHISGEVFVAGVCDIPRIESQIQETARQFPNVKKVKVFIGNRTLAEAIR